MNHGPEEEEAGRKTKQKTKHSVSHTDHFQRKHYKKIHFFFLKDIPFFNLYLFKHQTPTAISVFRSSEAAQIFYSKSIFREVESRADVSPKAVHRLNSSSE